MNLRMSPVRWVDSVESLSRERALSQAWALRAWGVKGEDGSTSAVSWLGAERRTDAGRGEAAAASVAESTVRKDEADGGGDCTAGAASANRVSEEDGASGRAGIGFAGTGASLG
jgi:hypothetical protein